MIVSMAVVIIGWKPRSPRIQRSLQAPCDQAVLTHPVAEKRAYRSEKTLCVGPCGGNIAARHLARNRSKQSVAAARARTKQRRACAAARALTAARAGSGGARLVRAHASQPQPRCRGCSCCCREPARGWRSSQVRAAACCGCSLRIYFGTGLLALNTSKGSCGCSRGRGAAGLGQSARRHARPRRRAAGASAPSGPGRAARETAGRTAIRGAAGRPARVERGCR